MSAMKGKTGPMGQQPPQDPQAPTTYDHWEGSPFKNVAIATPESPSIMPQAPAGTSGTMYGPQDGGVQQEKPAQTMQPGGVMQEKPAQTMQPMQPQPQPINQRNRQREIFRQKMMRPY